MLHMWEPSKRNFKYNKREQQNNCFYNNSQIHVLPAYFENFPVWVESKAAE